MVFHKQEVLFLAERKWGEKVGWNQKHRIYKWIMRTATDTVDRSEF